MGATKFILRFVSDGYRCAAAIAMLIGWALFAASASAQERYPLPGAGQPTGNGDAQLGNFGNGAGGERAGSAGTPFDQPAASPAADSRAATGAATTTEPNSFRNPTSSGAYPSKVMPLKNDAQSALGGTQSPTTQADYTTAPPNGVSSTQADGGLTPSALMRAMLKPPAGSLLRGQPVSLAEVIGSGRSRAEQTQRVDEYWNLCSSVADYYLSLLELQEMRKLRAYVPQAGAAWAQAESVLNVRVGTSLSAAQASQMEVASLMGRGSGNLPVPGDAPHCASYITHYQEIFPSGGPPEARELSALLPLRFAELQDADAAVTRSERFFDTFATSSNADGSDGLRAMELLALRRRAFVQIARDYNQRIARYAELASPGQISAGRLTSILINTSGSSTANRGASPAPPRSRQSSDGVGPPKTFVDGSGSPNRDDAVQRASATESTTSKDSPRREKSLLITRPRS